MTMPGLGMDTITVKRPSSSTSDAEGNGTDVLSTVYTGRGTWGSPSAKDVQRAAQRGQTLDAIFAMPFADVRVGDRVTVRSLDYHVLDVVLLRTHQRLHMREVA